MEIQALTMSFRFFFSKEIQVKIAALVLQIVEKTLNMLTFRTLQIVIF